MNAQIQDSAAFDIVMLADLRFPGGTSSSLADEIRAQTRAGYRTGLVQVFGPHVRGMRAVNPLLRHCIESGMAELVTPGRSVSARLALLRHPAVFEHPPKHAVPRIAAESVVLTANHAAVNAGGLAQYDPVQVTETITTVLGKEPLWAPIGPSVRASLQPWAGQITLRPTDWLNILDVDEWAVDRSRFVGERPVIGRHSRAHESKWPDTAQDILAVYPDSDEFRVRILGGARAPAAVLGAVPAAWEVEPFDARPARDFLSDIDFFVYFHHPDLVEAYGRTIMEAFASGVVAILPEHFRPVFGDAAMYGRPSDVQGLVRKFYQDQDRYRRQAARGHDFVRRWHGHEAHIERLGELIGPPIDRAGRDKETGAAERARSWTRRRRGDNNVLFISSNGAGMGHLTRLLAMARRTDGLRPVFFSLSQAVPVVASEGYVYEYFPSRGYLEIDTKTWNAAFARRFSYVMARHRPKAVVFDGTWPYLGIVNNRHRFPDVRFVWSRRGMWKADIPPDQLGKSEFFDLVIEPGEFAAEADTGATARATDALRVRPITLLDREELLPREDAMAELGLDPSRPAALVSLGAGNINDLTSDLGAVVATLSRDRDRQICLTRPPIAGEAESLPSQVTTVSAYPLSRYARAFDVAVAAAGYNSYHEMIAFGVPSVFLPNLQTATDDQLARARYAEKVGVGLCVVDVTLNTMAEAVEKLDDLAIRKSMTEQCRDLYPGNGAKDAMAAIKTLVETRATGETRE